MDRWATFDCYGTLVDWRSGIGGELARDVVRAFLGARFTPEERYRRRIGKLRQ